MLCGKLEDKRINSPETNFHIYCLFYLNINDYDVFCFCFSDWEKWEQILQINGCMLCTWGCINLL